MRNYFPLVRLGLYAIVLLILFTFKPVAQTNEGSLYQFAPPTVDYERQVCESFECMLNKGVKK
ncbi:MAG: hypothetical protein ACOYL6_12135 [Bacteriovoracaceae bacterium]